MHANRLFRETDKARLAARLRAHPFATLIAVKDGRPLAGHAPVVIDRDGEGWRLRFHLAISNPLVSAIGASGEALAIGLGGDAYISPDWYGAPDQVPTWNYLSVECEGPTRAIDDMALVALLDDLSAQEEARLAPKKPWTRGKMTPSVFAGMLKAIVGFEMRPTRFEGVTKLGQNKPEAQRRAAAAALGAHPIAALMADPTAQSERANAAIETSETIEKPSDS
jgi:transcriptional regulator